MFLIIFLMLIIISFLTLWPRYQANIQQKQLLVEKIDTLSRIVDDVAVKIKVMRREVRLTTEIITANGSAGASTGANNVGQSVVPTVSRHTTNQPVDSVMNRTPVIAPFDQRFYVFFGEYQSFYNAKRRYAELYESHNIVTEIVRLDGTVQEGRHIVVLASSPTKDRYTEPEAITLAKEYRNLGAKAVCQYAVDKYRTIK